MPFDAGSIVARMKLDKSQFTAGLAESQTQVKKWDAAVGAIFRGGLFATGIAFATQQLFKFAEEGARLSEIEGSFKRIAANAGLSGDQIIRLTRGATGALSKSEIQALADQLDLIGVGMEKLPQLARIAEAVGDATGKSTKATLQALIDGTARASDRTLALLGINVRFKEGMTEEQKQAEFLNQVLSQGADIVNRLGDNTESAADKLDKATSGMADFRAELEKMVSGPIAAYVGFLLKLKDLGVPTGPRSMWNLITGKGGGTPNEPLPTGQTNGWLFARKEAVDRQTAEAALAAQKAAKAYFDNLISRRGGGAVGGPKSMGGREGPLGIDQGDVGGGGLVGPGTEGLKALQHEVTVTADLVSGLGDSFAGFFEFLVTDSANAGKAFFSGIANAVAGVMSRMGDMLIYAGIGIESLKFLHGFAAIAAGIALKSIAGLFRGVASNNAPVTNSLGERSLRQPLTDSSKQGSLSIVIEGDFVGDRVWIDRLMEKIRFAQRNYGTSITVNKAGMAGA